MPTTIPPPGQLETARPILEPSLRPPEPKSATELTETLIVEPSKGEAIRPFGYRASDEELGELRRRILATRWPDRETVNDDSQGVQLATMQSSPITGRANMTGER